VNLGNRDRPRLVLPALSAVAVSVVAAVLPSLMSAWPTVIRIGSGGVMVVLAAGAAGAFIGELIAARRKLADDRRAAEADEDARRRALVDTRERAAIDQSVAGLLRPEFAVVEFTGRTDELARLQAWCSDEAACPVWLVTGPAGVGKTRLGLRLAESLPFEVWKCQMVKSGAEVTAVKAAAQLGQPVLLIVDNAQTRPGLPAMLTEIVLCEAPGLRVLLLARQIGDWWTELDAESDATQVLASRTPVLELAAALGDELNDLRVIKHALPFYAAARGRSVPQVTFTASSSARLPVLVLQTAALVAVLDDEHGTSGGRAAADLGVVDRLLGHERRLWIKTAQRVGLTVGLPVLEQVVAAVVILLDAKDNDESTVREVIRRVPDLKDASEECVGALTRWLTQLYAPDYERSGTLRPDLVAERHATDQLANHELFRRSCFADLPLPQAVRALTVLTRASAHHDGALGLIDRVLRQDLVGLADAAIVVAVQTGVKLGDVLSDVLKNGSAMLEDLQHIAEKIPYPSVALASAAVTVTRRVRDMLPTDGDPADKARWSNRLVTLLAQLGRPEEALDAAIEALRVSRRLAKGDPDVFRDDLARSLTNVAVVLPSLGHWEEALKAATEAVEIRRRPAKGRPDIFQDDLARSLTHQANHLSRLERREEALKAVTEAVEIRRRLAEDRPDRFGPGLAASLNNRANYLSDLGRSEEALKVITESVRVAREAAKANQDGFRSSLAGSLINQATYLLDLRQREEALKVAIEAVTEWRRLAEARPDIFRVGLAMSLNTLSNVLSSLGWREDALSASTESMDAHRESIKAWSSAVLPDFPKLLAMRGKVLVQLDRVKEGTLYYIEGINIAVGRRLTELVDMCIELLKQAYARDADAVAVAWRYATGEDCPSWLQSP